MPPICACSIPRAAQALTVLSAPFRNTLQHLKGVQGDTSPGCTKLDVHCAPQFPSSSSLLADGLCLLLPECVQRRVSLALQHAQAKWMEHVRILQKKHAHQC